MRTIKDKVTWIDVLKPNDGDIEALRKLRVFHPILLDEITHPSVRGRIEQYSKYMFVAYHIPIYDPQEKTSRRAEIDFLITKNTIVTAHHETLEPIEKLFQELLRSEEKKKDMLGKNSYELMYNLLQEFISFSARQLHHIEERVSFLSNEIFHDRSGDLLRKISYVKRDILDFRLITRPQNILFTALLENGIKFWGEDSRVYLADLIGDNQKLAQTLDNYYEIIESLETTNAQILSAQTNETIKKITAGAFLSSIPLFYIFAVSIPYIGDVLLATPLTFWCTFLAMIGLVGYLTYRFKKKKIL